MGIWQNLTQNPKSDGHQLIHLGFPTSKAMETGMRNKLGSIWWFDNISAQRCWGIRMIFWANSLVKLASPLLRPGNTLDGFRTVSDLTSWGAHVIILPYRIHETGTCAYKFLGIYVYFYGLVNAGKYYNTSGTNFSQGHPQIGWFSQAIPPKHALNYSN